MKILEVNATDVIGHIFNGYDLLHKLNKENGKFDVKQIVLDKRSKDEEVICIEKDLTVYSHIMRLEKKYAVSNVLFPYGEKLYSMPEFQSADIVHFHILHNDFISLLDYPKLMNAKKSVWTIHDPWILTGNCVYPLSCNNWLSGCKECHSEDQRYEMAAKNMPFMWELKKKILSQVNPDIIVSCNFMKKYLEQSPLTKHFNKIHVIPFGVDVSKYHPEKKREKKQLFGLDENKITIGFRVENEAIKGCSYIYDALNSLDIEDKVEIIVAGAGTIPNELKQKYLVRELGWVDDESTMISFMEATDIFLMPSLAESFGLMAIESMAAESVVVCFEGTVLEEIIDSPNCGIAVQYKSSKALAKAISDLIDNREDLEERALLGRKRVEENYLFEKYVEEHKRLYMNLENEG